MAFKFSDTENSDNDYRVSESNSKSDIFIVQSSQVVKNIMDSGNVQILSEVKDEAEEGEEDLLSDYVDENFE